MSRVPVAFEPTGHDRIHGQQFKSRFLRTSAPTSADGIEKYLSSGMIRGIGPVYAKKLAHRQRCRFLIQHGPLPSITPDYQTLEGPRGPTCATADLLRDSSPGRFAHQSRAIGLSQT
jgi:hypothetical protein